MSLHDRIMKDVDAFPFNTMSTERLEIYVEGFEQAKKQAAYIAAEADGLMAEMVEAIQLQKGVVETHSLLERYKAFKEQ